MVGYITMKKLLPFDLNKGEYRINIICVLHIIMLIAALPIRREPHY